MAYTHLVDKEKLDRDLTNISNEINSVMGTMKTRVFPDEFISDIAKLSMGDGQPTEPNIEVIEFIPPTIPQFKSPTGEFELWGWGIKDAEQAWNSTYYCFHGTSFSESIGGSDFPLTITVENGTPNGLPAMTRGKCLGVLKKGA